MKRYQKPKHVKPASRRKLQSIVQARELQLEHCQSMLDGEKEKSREAGRRASAAEFQRQKLEEQIRSMVEPKFNHFRMSMRVDGDVPLRDHMATWEFNGGVRISVVLDTNHVRMIQQGDKEAWMKAVIREFLIRCEEQAKQAIRLVG